MRAGLRNVRCHGEPPAFCGLPCGLRRAVNLRARQASRIATAPPGCRPRSRDRGKMRAGLRWAAQDAGSRRRPTAPFQRVGIFHAMTCALRMRPRQRSGDRAGSTPRNPAEPFCLSRNGRMGADCRAPPAWTAVSAWPAAGRTAQERQAFGHPSICAERPGSGRLGQFPGGWRHLLTGDMRTMKDSWNMIRSC
jgi:hypothetical protein